MSLVACQVDPTLRSLETRAVACRPGPDGGWQIALEDTVLYPEGGGQPADHGTIADARITHVFRDADGGVWHQADAPVDLGPVSVQVDWARRWDITQQHSAQHLLTAITQDCFGQATTSFHLHAQRCDIELEGALDEEALVALEDAVNDAILADLPVRLRLVDAAALSGLGVRTRGLPEGLTGPVRLVEIEGVDVNTCGGTHVQRTGQLGVIKLLGTERMRGGTRLFFNAGDRVRRQLDAALAREAELTRLLTSGPDEHAAAVARLLDASKQAARDLRALRADLAVHLGAACLASDGVAVLHRDEADLGFLGAIAAACPDDGALRLFTGGPASGAGVFLLTGPADCVAALGPGVAEALAGRGGGRGGRYQGKATAMEHRTQAEAVLRGGVGPA